MTAPARRPALVPAAALCAALTAAASTGAWAGEEPVVPFPGPSVPGTSVSGPSVPGTSVSGPSVPGVVEGGKEKSAAAGDETAAAPDGGADVPDTAKPAVDAEPSDAAAPGGAMAPARVSPAPVSAEKADVPAGGSRLLRALAERRKTLVPEPGSVPDGAAGSGSPRGPGTSVFAAEGCPRALLRRLLAGAAGEADALSALGIEREILILCRERQEILAGLFETEARLSELREAARTPEPRAPLTAASAAQAPRVKAPGGAPEIETAAPSPLRAALGGAAGTVLPETADEADPRAPEPQPPAEVSPRYAWFSIIGTAGSLRAGVTDGTGVWFVREGDPLPGGATVAAIAGRPPGVRVTVAGETLVPGTPGRGSGEAVLLPFGARPGGGP